MKKPRRAKRALRVGITGSLGSGKSTVAGLFASFGANLIDADRIAFRLLEKDQTIKRKILRAWGKRVCTDKGDIDKAALAGVVFFSKKKLAILERIMHPEILRIIRRSLQRPLGAVSIVDAPLLYESGLDREMDYVVVVASSAALALKRLRERAGMSVSQFRRRLRYQMPLRDKIRMADFVIDNNGSFKKTKQQVLEIWNKLTKGRNGKKI